MPQTRSEMALPLKARERVIGVMDVQSVEPEAFSQEDVAVLQILADQVALAVENARLFQEAQERLRETDQLLRRYGQEQWSRLAAERPSWGYVYDGVDVVRRDEAQTETQQADLVVPLEVRQQSIGRLSLELGGRSLTPDETELIQAISEQASLSLENARLFLETQRTLLEVEALYQAGRAIGSATSAQEVAKILVDFASPNDVDTARVLFFEQDERGQPSHIVMSEGWRSDDRPPQPLGTRLLIADYPLTDFLNINEPVLVQDVLADPRANEATRNLLRILGLRSFAIIPISVGQRWLGAIFVGRVEPSAFGEDFVRGYQTLAGQAAVALESLRLFQETQSRAERERLVGEVTTQVRQTLDVDTVLQSTVQELGRALGLAEVVIQLKTADGTGAPPDERGF
jgi:GAF domain-containing protein